MSTSRDSIILSAQGLHRGDTRRMLCPTCGGGSTQEHSLCVSRTMGGEVAWICFRAGCDEQGRSGDFIGTQPQRDSKPEVRPYRGEIWPLGAEDYKVLWNEYGIGGPTADAYIRSTCGPAFWLPCHDSKGRIWGSMVRQPWATFKHREVDPNEPKARLYWHRTDCSRLAWYGVGPSTTGEGIVLVVEDQLSALMAAERGHWAVALLGTDLNQEKVRDIQRCAGSRTVVLALDSDATEKAFKLASKWSAAFTQLRVAVLHKDIKDDPEQLSGIRRLA